MAETSPLLAVLIDADNVPAKYAEAVLREVTVHGQPGLRRVYGDWSNDHIKGWISMATEHGLLLHQESAFVKGKNTSDIGLVIDAMDIMHQGRFDGFVLVSSDSDFTALAIRIREQGLTVIGIGEAKTPDALKNACNRFVRLENLVDEAPAQGEAKGRKDSPGKARVDEATPLIKAAMDKIESDDDWVSLSQIGQEILKDVPDFDSRTYGERSLGRLVKKLKGFRTKMTASNQMLVTYE
ncbi:NYN domain-containing protein [Rhodalgimonas zhirmunskyi]|uniref:NYN domain-containing protein n=1 Tax=Rhodalgimonas zhirmunskyi TaxID=2964767 RepID=A0AAJ1X613_9RHOB|nr:NYN domain-containing protein [Rhodoalgimonas zhirmunskyi]MDQ2095798.1 NYN domain-containing protein [Rhodoalgimonas zhirmunskyi]